MKSYQLIHRYEGSLNSAVNAAPTIRRNYLIYNKLIICLHLRNNILEVVFYTIFGYWPGGSTYIYPMNMQFKIW